MFIVNILFKLYFVNVKWVINVVKVYLNLECYDFLDNMWECDEEKFILN